MALPFPKFFNHDQKQNTVSAQLDYISVKFDGSLGICYHDPLQGKWRINTRGSFTSPQSRWASEWFQKNVAQAGLDKSITYLFEIIYKENRIVVDYTFQGLVLIGAYNIYTGLELEYTHLLESSKILGVQITPRVDVELDELLAMS